MLFAINIKLLFRSAEGEILHQFHRVLELENEGSIFIIFPLTICHVIDEKSPLFYLSAKSMIEKRFEYFRFNLFFDL